jgi:uncharacterized protein
MIQAFHFGEAHEPLFGTYHPAERERRPASGVLLCNPWGEEAVRAHRTLRVLATRLAREGAHVLRFDYYGTGDSSGSSFEGTPTRWEKNIRRAHDELVERSRASQITWVGLRYGANLALSASARPTRLDRLILWDPVLNGTQYLAELVQDHAAYMRELPHWRPAEDAPPQALGWPITEELRTALERLDLSVPRFTSARRTVAMLSNPDPRAREVVARLVEGQTTDVRVVQSPSPWNSDEALNATLVPAEIVSAIIEAVKEPC